MSRQRLLTSILIVVVVIFAGLVLVGNIAVAHTNPPVTYTVKWDSPETETLAQRACMDCHSNVTRYPWYAYIAPISFLVQKDIDEGRKKLNFSTGHELEGDEMLEQIERNKMPVPIYMTMHPEANLTAAEKEQLISGLQKTFGR